MVELLNKSIEATAICVAGKPQKQKNEEPEPEGEAFLE